MVLDVDDLEKITNDVIEKLKEEKADEREVDGALLHEVDVEIQKIEPKLTTEECD